MEYTKLGQSGLEVSRLALGTMGFGDPVNWVHKWALDEAGSRPIIKKALDLGINFFDTANAYSNGVSEQIVGNALNDFASRAEVVIATKVYWQTFEGPNGQGLSRKAIFSEVEKSLKNLKTDYIDLYIIHHWDYTTPIEETMSALNDLVRSGKVRYIGASNMFAWQFEMAQNIAEQHNWTKFISMEDHLNLLYREEEREMLPYAKAAGVGVIPYSPLAAGRLTRDPSKTSFRLETDQVAKRKYDSTKNVDIEIINRVGKIANDLNVSRAAVSLAWLLHKDVVSAPIIGATKLSHLDSAIKALSVNLSKDQISYLEEPYVPHQLVGVD